MSEEPDLIDITDTFVVSSDEQPPVNTPITAEDIQQRLNEHMNNAISEMQKMQEEMVQQGLIISRAEFDQMLARASEYEKKSLFYLSFTSTMGEKIKSQLAAADDTFIPTKEEILAWYEDYQLVIGEDDNNVGKMGKILYECTNTFKAVTGGEKLECCELQEHEPCLTTDIGLIQQFIIEFIVADMVLSKASVHKVDLQLPGRAFGDSGFDCWDMISNGYLSLLQKISDKHEYEKIVKAITVPILEYGLFREEYLGLQGIAVMPDVTGDVL